MDISNNDNKTNNNKSKWLSFSAAFFVAAVAVLGLQACSSGGDSAPAPAPVVDAKPAGYYSSGDATVNDPMNTANNLVISDLQAMVNGNRFMMMSLSNALMYDATITDITGNDFTADVVIYYNMGFENANVTPDPVINTTIAGTITEGSNITGTIAGTGIGSGNFSLTFSQTNSAQAALANVENDWTGLINTVEQSAGFRFSVDSAGVVDVNASDEPTEGLFDSCEMTGTIMPVSDSALFTLNLNVTVDSCIFNSGNRDGDHTGLITTISKTNPNDTLIIMFNNGSVAGMAEWSISPP